MIWAMSIREVSRAIGKCVNTKVGTLQTGYLAGRASSRASLARLRRLDTAGEASWMSVGEELFADLPDFDLGEDTERKELESVRAALQLYAILQQSKKNPVAMFPGNGVTTGSLGNACYLCVKASNGKGAPGFMRRLSSIEASTDFAGAMVGVRSLVRLIRTAKVEAPIQLDFGRLASDLFEIQFEETRGDVFMRWARDYYKANPKQDDQKAQTGRG